MYKKLTAFIRASHQDSGTDVAMNCFKMNGFLLTTFLLIQIFASPAYSSMAPACQMVFKSTSPSLTHQRLDLSPSGLTQKDFDSIQSLDQLKPYAEHLLEKNTDAISMILALWETRAVKDARWQISDVAFFLHHLETKYGLRPLEQTKIETLNTAQVADGILQEIIKWYKGKLNEGPELGKILEQKSAALEQAQAQSMSREVRNKSYLKLLKGDHTENPDLKMVWRINYPENPVQVGNLYWYLRPHRKPTIDYVIEPDPESPYKAINRFLGKVEPDDRFFNLLYKNYQDRIRDDIIAKVKRVETALPAGRQAYGMVYDHLTSEALGTMRVFDGTPRRLNDIFISGRQESSPVLPFEAIFKMRNISVNYIKQLEKMRLTTPYTPVFEIGKLSLEGSAKVRDRSMKALELFLLQYYLSRYPDGIYLVHVASEAHLKLYQKRYGFKIAESVPIPGTDQVEHVLSLSGAEFRQALTQRLGLTSPEEGLR